MDTPVTITFSFNSLAEAMELVEAVKLYGIKKQPLEIQAIKVKSVKVCETCKQDFHPKSNRQKFCSQKCGLKPAYKPKKKKPIEPIGKTLKEIQYNQQLRESQPYEFGR